MTEKKCGSFVFVLVFANKLLCLGKKKSLSQKKKKKLYRRKIMTRDPSRGKCFAGGSHVERNIKKGQQKDALFVSDLI